MKTVYRLLLIGTGYIVFKREARGFASRLFKPARRFSIREAEKASLLGFYDTRIKNEWAKDHKQQRRVLWVLVLNLIFVSLGSAAYSSDSES